MDRLIMRSDHPTPGERKVLRAINETRLRKGLCPTVREIGALIGCTHGPVQYKINRLVRKGLLTRIDGHPRSLTITKRGRDELLHEELKRRSPRGSDGDS